MLQVYKYYDVKSQFGKNSTILVGLNSHCIVTVSFYFKVECLFKTARI